MKKPSFFFLLFSLAIGALHLLVNDYNINIFFKQLSATFLCGIILMMLISYRSLGEDGLERIMLIFLGIISTVPIFSIILDASSSGTRFVAVIIGYLFSMWLTYVVINDFKSS